MKYNGDKFILNIYNSKYGNNKNKGIDVHRNYEYGDILKVKGKIVIPELLGNPHEFNYKKYLNSIGICGTISSYEVNLQEEQKRDLGYFLYELREYENELIDKAIENTETAGILKSFIYGDKESMQEDVKNTFTNLGISHMLVASGSNIMVVIILLKTVTKGMNMTKYVKSIILCVGIIVFVALCNFEYSITRAGIVGILNVLLNLFNKKIKTYKKIFISLYILYILNPMCIYNVGLRLSFLATLSIIFFNQKLELRINWFVNKKVGEKYSKILKPVISLFCVTLSASIGTLPIQINNFNSYSLLSIFSNILLGIITGIIRNVGIFAIVISVFPNISIILYKVLNPLISLTIYVTKFLERLSVEIYFRELPVYIVIMYYILLLIIIIKDNLVIKKFSLSRKFSCIMDKLKSVAIYVLLLGLITHSVYVTCIQDYLIFFNVKQGDMAYIKQKGVNILVDCGSETENLASNVFLNFCKKENIQKLDLIILSHFHQDHINGIYDIAEEVEISKVVFALPREKNEEYIKLKEFLTKKDIPFEIVEKGDKISIKDIQIFILSPGNKKIKDDDIENANSLVCKIELGDVSCLFTGDSTKNTEQYILKQNENLSADILKVGHHGSKTSTSDIFINNVSPEIAVISSYKKVYGHPNEETLKVLNSNFVDTYITEEKGAIKIIF